MKFLVKNIDQLDQLTADLIRYAGTRKKWCFQGDLAAGKTTLIKAIGRQLQVREEISSPTYSLVNEYAYPADTSSGMDTLVYHLDLYRLNSLEEALDIGIEEYLYNDSYCFIEWPELIEFILPEDILTIHLSVQPDEERIVTIS